MRYNSAVPATCPMCRKPVPDREGNRAYPFCSDRCKLLDLGRWLAEDYRVPGPPAGDGGERRATEDDADA